MGEGRTASWGDRDVVALFATDGHSDPGEAAALAQVEPQRHGRVLDLGIGGGRTTGLLAADASAPGREEVRLMLSMWAVPYALLRRCAIGNARVGRPRSTNR